MALTQAYNLNPRVKRKTLLLFGIESDYGIFKTGMTVADNAIQVEDVDFKYSSNNQKRNVLRPYLGGLEELVGDDSIDLSFTVEAGGGFTSESTTEIPIVRYHDLFRACGMVQTELAKNTTSGQIGARKFVPTSVQSNGIGSYNSCSFIFAVDGVRYLAYGGRGSWELDLTHGQVPKFKFTFTCLFDGGVATQTFNLPEYQAQAAPYLVQNTTSRALFATGSSGAAAQATMNWLSGRLAAATSNWTEYGNKGLSLSFGNKVQFQPMLGQNRVLITDREVTGKVTLDLSAEDENDLMAMVRANNTRSLGFEHGLSGGSIIKNNYMAIYAPKVQLINPSHTDQDGISMCSYDARLMTVDRVDDQSDNYGDNELALFFA